MLKSGIDIGNRIFFGTTHSSTHGYYDHSHKCIWLDDIVLERFLTSPNLEDKAYLFRCIFHEMQHAVQHHNIDNGNINYLTYNFIKENIIQEYDEEYYSANYTSLFIESDARREEILGSLEFLKGLNPNFVNILKQDATRAYVFETRFHPIYKDSTKKMSVGQNGTKINVSDYVGFLIHSNPQILFDSPILRIEYNPDGSYKSLETLLDDFEQIERDGSQNFSNIYSIYYGLILKAAPQAAPNDIQLQERISAFFKQHSQLVSYSDMQICFQHVPQSSRTQLYARLISILKEPDQTSTPNDERGDKCNVDI